MKKTILLTLGLAILSQPSFSQESVEIKTTISEEMSIQLVDCADKETEALGTVVSSTSNAVASEAMPSTEFCVKYATNDADGFTLKVKRGNDSFTMKHENYDTLAADLPLIGGSAFAGSERCSASQYVYSLRAELYNGVDAFLVSSDSVAQEAAATKYGNTPTITSEHLAHCTEASQHEADFLISDATSASGLGGAESFEEVRKIVISPEVAEADKLVAGTFSDMITVELQTK